MKAQELLENQGTSEAATMTTDKPESPKVDESVEAMSGEREGRRWAIYQATAIQLSVLAAIVEEYEAAKETAENPALFLDFWLALTIGDVYGREFVDTRSYRSVFPKAALHSTAYVGAFVRAAAEVWRDCQAEIEAE